MIQLEADGTYPEFAWPGGYPIYYIMDAGEALCAKCANENRELDTGDKNGWHVIGQDINWEDSELFCAHCNQRISAYAEEEAKHQEENIEQVMEWLDFYDDREASK